MSPLLLRQYRANRLLREEFETLRGQVIGSVAARLRATGTHADRDDLDAAYAQAWQGLYAAVIAGREIANPAGWLTVVAYRRAIDERRARGRATPTALDHPEIDRGTVAASESDMACSLDDRARLRSLLEALRARLSERERQAAALCYLQGLTRAEAAARMGISESRMRKLMEGAGRGLRGVAAKVGALAQMIAAGEWCEQQGSLMRGLAFGMLDPRGERYRVAMAHAGQCPACRAYVRSLRGLAAILPPSPLVLRWIAAAASGGAGASAAAGGAAAGVGGGGVAGPGTAPAAGATAGTGLGSGALAASGASGAAGGSWWLAGGVGAKLAVGCVLAASIGAGCIAIEGDSHESKRSKRARLALAAGDRRSRHGSSAGRLDASAVTAALSGHEETAVGPRVNSSPSRLTAPAAAAREFGPEDAARRTGAAASGSATTAGARAGGWRVPRARAASIASSAPSTRRAGNPTGGSGTGGPAAEREFAPG